MKSVYAAPVITIGYGDPSCAKRNRRLSVQITLLKSGSNMKKYKLVIFDMDGTILNTLEDLADSTNEIMGRHGFPLHTLDEIRMYVGNGLENLMRCAAPADTADAVIQELLPEFRAYYQAHCRDKTGPYAGITELIRQVHQAGLLTAVVSNKPDSAVGKLSSEVFPGLMDLAMGESSKIRRKPAPDMVFATLDRLGVRAEEALYVGDSDVDFCTAENAGMDCALVSWGFRGSEFIRRYPAKYHVDTAEELLKVLSIAG